MTANGAHHHHGTANGAHPLQGAPDHGTAHQKARQLNPASTALGSLCVSPRSTPNTEFFSRVLQRGVVNTTVSNMPYASLTNTRATEAGPFIPQMACGCGQANPDSCVESLGGTSPFLDAPLSREMMEASYNSSPYLSVTPVQAYMQLRASPLNM